MVKKAMRNKTQESTLTCDKSLSKLPEATADQLNLANLLSKKDDVDLSSFVAKLRELTECTEDQAVTALYDSENNLERAVELLLDKFRLTGEEWHTSKRKQKSKPLSKQEREPTNAIVSNRLREQNKKHSQTKSEPSDQVHLFKDRKPGLSGAKNSVSESSAIADSDKSESTYPSDVRDHKNKVNRMRDADGWDPYTEYGGWGGESIEVINSNASIAKLSQQNDGLDNELFVESDEKKSFSEQNSEDGHSSQKPSPSTLNVDSASIFVSKALSKPPPRAFTNLHFGEVFVVPDLPHLSWDIKFGGEHFSDYVPKNSIRKSSHEDCNAALQSVDNQMLTNSSKSPSYSSTKSDKIVNKNLLDNSTQADFKAKSVNKYPSDNLLDDNLHPNTNAISATQKSPRPTSFGNEKISSQSGYMDPSLKSYILDNLPDELKKLAVDESPLQSSKASQYNYPQTQSNTANQSVSISMQQSVGKSSHLPGTSQPSHQSSINAGLPQTQQNAGLPPGMPHFIGQFTSPPYMFNLPGASSNTPAFLDMDQLQLFQHHQKMLYDMQLQQHVATTGQSLLTSNSDAPAISKPISQNIPSSIGHITAANSAIRPELLASAMGHAPQMMPPGNPYFSYPGFVLMNGYPNAFMNQHQQSNTDGSNLNTTLGTSMNPSSTGSQAYSGLKPGLDELFDMKYPDHSKQVGFKNQAANPNNFNFQVPSTVGEMSKLSNQAGSLLNQSGFNANTGANNGCQQQQQQQQQAYASQFFASSVSNAAASPYLTAAVAAAVAASAQQQAVSANSNIMSGHGSTANKPNGGPTGGSNQVNQLQLSSAAAAAQAMGLHHPHAAHTHQRSVMHHHPH